MVWFNNPITRIRYAAQTFDAFGDAVWTVESTEPMVNAGSQDASRNDLRHFPEGDRWGVTKKIFCRRGDLRAAGTLADTEIPPDRVIIDGATYEVGGILPERRHVLPHDEVIVVRVEPFAQDPTT